ncbi:archease [Azotobacter sp. CWF10]
MPWQTFSHEADVGVRGIGATPAEAFAGAASALTAAICDPAAVVPRETVTVDCEAPDLELLLVDWLNALIFEMATRHLLFSHFELAIDGTRLHATAWGEPLDVARHQPAAEAKGVSFCELKVARQADGQWLAQAVVDV